MDPQNLLISNDQDIYRIKVIGRANFEYAVPLRQLSHCLNSSLAGIVVDASECTFVDSTFMGVLSMLGLQARKFDAVMEICGAPENVRNLLRGLGVDKLFAFSNADGSAVAVDNWYSPKPEKTALDTAETVAEAHHTLADADTANAAKFKDVIKYADADVDRLKNK